MVPATAGMISLTIAERPAMPPVRLKHLERGRDRQGRIKYLWFRNRAAGGPRIPLPGPEGSAEFLEDYHAALAGELQPAD